MKRGRGVICDGRKGGDLRCQQVVRYITIRLGLFRYSSLRGDLRHTKNLEFVFIVDFIIAIVGVIIFMILMIHLPRFIIVIAFYQQYRYSRPSCVRFLIFKFFFANNKIDKNLIISQMFLLSLMKSKKVQSKFKILTFQKIKKI